MRHGSDSHATGNRNCNGDSLDGPSFEVEAATAGYATSHGKKVSRYPVPFPGHIIWKPVGKLPEHESCEGLAV